MRGPPTPTGGRGIEEPFVGGSPPPKGFQRQCRSHPAAETVDATPGRAKAVSIVGAAQARRNVSGTVSRNPRDKHMPGIRKQWLGHQL